MKRLPDGHPGIAPHRLTQQFKTKARASYLRHAFGLELTDYDEMLLSQNGVCAICEQPETMTRNGAVKHLAVDHDHETNHKRELLCSRCNTLLGWARDNVDLLLRAAVYLEKHETRS